MQRALIPAPDGARRAHRSLGEGFSKIETPYLIKSTPRGARDFVVPSRMNPNQFYALPQSPQTLKQLLMVAGYDNISRSCAASATRIADRQPEFTQIDCEMSFVEQEDVLEVFERWAKHMFREVLGVDFAEPFRRMPWIEAMSKVRIGQTRPALPAWSSRRDRPRQGAQVRRNSTMRVRLRPPPGCAGYTASRSTR